MRLPPWIAGLPGASAGGLNMFVIVALPFLLSRRGLSLDQIAGISAIALSPSFWGVLVAPVVDMGLTRRIWFVILTAVMAVCLAGSLSIPNVSAMAALLTIGGLAQFLYFTNWSGWCASFISEDERGRVGGWANGFYYAAGAILPMAVMWMSEKVPPLFVAVFAATAIVVPGLAALRFPDVPLKASFCWQDFAGTWRQVWRVSMTPRFLICFVVFLAPSGAALNLLSGLGEYFRAGGSQIIWVTGLGSALGGAIGALAGGWLSDTIDRYYAYIACGLLCGLWGAAFAVCPHTPYVYTIGVLGYAFITGASGGAGQGLIFEGVGTGNPVAASQSALLLGASFGCMSYTTWIDGQGYRLLGVSGLLGIDSTLAMCTAGILFLFLRRFRSRRLAHVLETSAA